ncbi:MAG: tetratricopeptide repeat protein [Bacteroidia bacterium]|nr:tetratricopeptide repeat protein [Bacteroidia bacterium]
MKRIITLSFFAGLLFLTTATTAQTLDEAIRAINTADYKKARSILNTIITQQPKKPEPLYYMGLSYLESAQDQEDIPVKNDELEKARDYFNRGIAANAKYPYNFVGLGRYYVEKKNFAEAKSNFDKGLAINASDVSVLVTIADGYLTAKDRNLTNEAEKLLTRAQALNSKNPDIFISLGDVYMNQNVEELPLNKYNQAASLDPNNVRAHYRIGQYYVKYKKYQEGANAFMKAISIDPKFAPAYRDMGELYFLAKDYKKAKESYKKYVELTANDLQARARYCQFLYLSKDYATAVEEITTALKDTTTNVLLRLYGYSLYETGKYPEAKTAMDKYFGRVKPEFIIARDNEYYGKILDKLGQKDQALSYYEKAIAMDSGMDSLYSKMADIYNYQKNYTKAAEVLEKLISSKPTIQNYYSLGEIYYKLENWEKAITAYTKTTEIKPDFHMGYLKIARCNFQLDPETTEGKAQPAYQKYLEIINTLPNKDNFKKEQVEANSYLAYYYYNVKKDNALSRSYYEKVKELDPTNEQANKMLDYFKKAAGK